MLTIPWLESYLLHRLIIASRTRSFIFLFSLFFPNPAVRSSGHGTRLRNGPPLRDTVLPLRRKQSGTWPFRRAATFVRMPKFRIALAKRSTYSDPMRFVSFRSFFSIRERAAKKRPRVSRGRLQGSKTIYRNFEHCLAFYSNRSRKRE